MRETSGKSACGWLIDCQTPTSREFKGRFTAGYVDLEREAAHAARTPELRPDADGVRPEQRRRALRIRKRRGCVAATVTSPRCGGKAHGRRGVGPGLCRSLGMESARVALEGDSRRSLDPAAAPRCAGCCCCVQEPLYL